MTIRVVLASGSLIRRQMLERSGVVCEVRPAFIDESRIRAGWQGQNWDDLATELALLKATQVAQTYSEEKVLVIGADQILVHEGTVYGKAETAAELGERLMHWRGTPHHLVTACVLLWGGNEVWRVVERPCLTMRKMSDNFIATYASEATAEDLASVGGYRIEEKGLPLFSHIEGDYHTIQGLPLLPLLDILRRWEVIAT